MCMTFCERHATLKKENYMICFVFVGVSVCVSVCVCVGVVMRVL